MNNVWKWILGILAVLLIVGALVAVPLVMHSYFGANMGTGFERQAWRMPMHDFDGPGGFNRGGGPMMGRRGFDRYGYGFSPLFGGFMLLGGLFRLALPLGLLGLIIWFAYQQGKKAGMRAATPPAPASEPAAES